ncbi:hypothetical protein ScPMuIL_001391 [Solemya velum]
MFTTSGYFRGLSCPFFLSGLCERPYCHFRHVKTDTKEKHTLPGTSDSYLDSLTDLCYSGPSSSRSLSQTENEVKKETRHLSTECKKSLTTQTDGKSTEQSVELNKYTGEPLYSSSEVNTHKPTQITKYTGKPDVHDSKHEQSMTIRKSGHSKLLDQLTHVAKAKQPISELKPGSEQDGGVGMVIVPEYNPTPICELKKRHVVPRKYSMSLAEVPLSEQEYDPLFNYATAFSSGKKTTDLGTNIKRAHTYHGDISQSSFEPHGSVDYKMADFGFSDEDNEEEDGGGKWPYYKEVDNDLKEEDFEVKNVLFTLGDSDSEPNLIIAESDTRLKDSDAVRNISPVKKAQSMNTNKELKDSVETGVEKKKKSKDRKMKLNDRILNGRRLSGQESPPSGELCDGNKAKENIGIGVESTNAVIEKDHDDNKSVCQSGNAHLSLLTVMSQNMKNLSKTSTNEKIVKTGNRVTLMSLNSMERMKNIDENPEQSKLNDKSEYKEKGDHPKTNDSSIFHAGTQNLISHDQGEGTKVKIHSKTGTCKLPSSSSCDSRRSSTDSERSKSNSRTKSGSSRVSSKLHSDKSSKPNSDKSRTSIHEEKSGHSGNKKCNDKPHSEKPKDDIKKSAKNHKTSSNMSKSHREHSSKHQTSTDKISKLQKEGSSSSNLQNKISAVSDSSKTSNSSKTFVTEKDEKSRKKYKDDHSRSRDKHSSSKKNGSSKHSDQNSKHKSGEDTKSVKHAKSEHHSHNGHCQKESSSRKRKSDSTDDNLEPKHKRKIDLDGSGDDVIVISSSSETQEHDRGKNNSLAKSPTKKITDLNIDLFGEDSDDGGCDARVENFSDISDSELCQYLSESDFDDMDTYDECLKIFNEAPRRLSPSKGQLNKQISTMKSTDECPAVKIKKRTAHHSSAEINRKIPEKPFSRLSAAQVMHNRFAELHRQTQKETTIDKKNNEDSVSSSTKMALAGKKRLAHIRTEKTIPITASKTAKRVAHTPTVNLKRPTIPTEFGSKVPSVVRQRYLNAIIEECLKIYSSAEEAFKKGQEEETAVYNRSSSKTVYLNVAVNTIKRLRTEASPEQTKQKLSTSPLKISHEAILWGKHASSCTMNRSKGSLKGPLGDFKGNYLYKKLKSFLLNETQLRENGFPRPSTESGGIATFYSENMKAKQSSEVQQKVCIRCGTRFYLYPNGKYAKTEECLHHWGKAWKKRVDRAIESRYNCCQGDLDSRGCQLAKGHVHESNKREILTGYMKTIPSSPPIDGDYGVYAMDCEMVYTTGGFELARVTVVGADQNPVYESFVKPDTPIIDYNTRFSGIKEEDLKNVKTTLHDVQAVLLSLFSSQSILLGHSLESDLTAVKIIHDTVVDTSVVFPHRLGPPYKRALRNLMSEYVQKIIQDNVDGHDSQEDAVACLQLMQWKLKEEFRRGMR